MQRRIVFAALFLGTPSLSMPPARADECTAVIAAMEVSAKLPRTADIYLADEHGVPASGKSVIGRIVQTDTTKYVQANGKWGAQKSSTDDASSQLEARLKTDRMTCRKLAEETVHGQLTTKYSVHIDGARGATDNTFWIADNGYQLKSALQQPGGQIVTEFGYNNVQAPDMKPEKTKQP